MNKAKTGASVLKDKIEDLDQISMEYGKKQARNTKEMLETMKKQIFQIAGIDGREEP